MQKILQIFNVIIVTTSCFSIIHENGEKSMRHFNQIGQLTLNHREEVQKDYSNSTDNMYKIQLNQSSPYYKEAADPYQQLYQHALHFPDIRDVFVSRKELNEDQYFKIYSFMLNHSYFQQKLIGQLKNIKQSKWVRKLPPSAQVRLLKILGSINIKDAQKQQKWKQIESRIRQDYDIGPAYSKYSKRNPRAKSLMKSFQVMMSNYL